MSGMFAFTLGDEGWLADTGGAGICACALGIKLRLSKIRPTSSATGKQAKRFISIANIDFAFRRQDGKPLIMQEILQAILMALDMGWQMLWALVLGFFISGAIQAVVSHKEMASLLPDDRWPSILKAAGLGAASSSCSYAAVAIARSVVKTGGDFKSAMIFQFASTNLVIELGLILWTLMGWRFMAASWLGGLVMIPVLTVLMRLFLSRPRINAAVAQARKNLPGRMEGHATMDMAVKGSGSTWCKLLSAQGFTATAHFFVMDWVSLWVDLGGGLLIAGALAAWIPAAVWGHLFLTGHPMLSRILGPFIGPLVAMITFVCSIGNAPLAAVLWQGGASFGGVIAFIFGDLIVLPILDIYRRYYGWKTAGVLFVLFYVAMATAGLAVEGLFAGLHLTPQHKATAIMSQSWRWNYTAWLNLIALLATAALIWRFLTTGGPGMLRHMNAHATPQAKPSC